MQSNKKSNLLPCPFCGSKDIYCFDAGHKTNVWFVQCNDCCATFPHFDSKEEAEKAWNTRANKNNQIADIGKIIFCSITNKECIKCNPGPCENRK